MVVVVPHDSKMSLHIYMMVTLPQERYHVVSSVYIYSACAWWVFDHKGSWFVRFPPHIQT